MILLSGGMDPLHVGHVRMIESAHSYGRVVIALNSDEWLMRKKGYAFMPWKERAEILRALRHVSGVERVDDADGTVCEALERLQPAVFGNGGDRTSANPLEHEVCLRLRIKELFGLGGAKVRSSSTLVDHLMRFAYG
jgi:cytidyltransferase-like protein